MIKDMANKKKSTSATLGSHPNVKVVTSRQEFEKEAQRLRANGFVEVPGFLGGGKDGGITADYGDYINASLACKMNAGDKGTAVLPMQQVSSGGAVPMKAQNGYEGNMMSWGAGNKTPNVVSFFCSLLPYTAAALKFNIDMCCGMGPRPMYSYSQYVGGNITHKAIPYEDAGVLLKGWIRDLKRELTQIEASQQPQDDGMEQYATDNKNELAEDIRQQIETLEKEYAVWEQTNAEVKAFLENNNLLQTFQQLYSDMLQYNICFPEFELQQTYLVETTNAQGGTTKKPVPASQWSPKVVGLKWRNAKTIRLEQLTKENRIEHVFVSNAWLSSPEQTVITKDSDFKVDALPALSYQSPAADMERLARNARAVNADKNARPTHVVMPVIYNEYGHPYYPVPAWYSVFSGDVYTYASLLIADRKKRRDNANVIGRILYLNDEYMQRLYHQRACTTDEEKKKLFNEVISSINQFLKNRDNMGEPLLAYTFKDADGKVYKSWEIVEVEENNASQAEANKEELAEISSIILFAWGVDSQLIGNTPGTTTRSGGTDLRERYLLKQINMSTMQSLVMNSLNVVKTRNQWDPHLCWQIKKEVLTTLDNSKTGLAEAENN
jgi:hypothetical protein